MFFFFMETRGPLWHTLQWQTAIKIALCGLCHKKKGISRNSIMHLTSCPEFNEICLQWISYIKAGVAHPQRGETSFIWSWGQTAAWGVALSRQWFVRREEDNGWRGCDWGKVKNEWGAMHGVQQDSIFQDFSEITRMRLKSCASVRRVGTHVIFELVHTYMAFISCQ